MPIEKPPKKGAINCPSRIVSAARYRQLLSELGRIEAALTACVEKDDAPAIRGGLVQLMHVIEQAFTPDLQERSLLSARLITEVLVAAGDGHKHWLIAEPDDGQRNWRNSPYAKHLQISAASVLEAFTGTGVSEEKLCKKIADALCAGGYGKRSESNSALKPFGISTIRHWREALANGSQQPEWLLKDYHAMVNQWRSSNATRDEALEQLRAIAQENAPKWVTPQRRPH